MTRALAWWTLRNPQLWFAPLMALITVAIAPTIGFTTALPFFALTVFTAHRPLMNVDAALPVHGRTVVAGRILALVVLLLVPTGLWAAWIVVQGLTLAFDRTVFDVFGLTALMIVAPEVVRAGSPSVRVRTPFITWGGVLGVSVTLMLLPHAALRATLLALLVAVLAHVMWRRIPEAIVVAPATLAHSRGASRRAAKPGTDDGAEGTSASDVGGRLRWREWGLLAHYVGGGFRWYLWCAIVLGTSFLGSSYALPVYLLIATGIMLGAMNWLQPLPLSARSRLHLLLAVGPVGLSAIAALGINLSFYVMKSPNRLSVHAVVVEERGRWYGNPTEVPFAYWVRTPAAGAPVIVAPWGERAEPFTTEVAGVEFYNPYTTRRASTGWFINWQFARVTQAVYGQAMSREAYKNGDLSRRVTLSLPMQMLMGSACLAYVMLALWLMLYQRRVTATLGPRARLLGPHLSFLPVYLLLALEVTWGFPVGGNLVASLLQQQFLQLIAALNGSMPLIALVSAGPVAAAYLALLRLYPTIEVEAAVPAPRG